MTKPTDSMPIMRDFDCSFDVLIEVRRESKNDWRMSHSSGIQIDGNFSTIFQAEIYAIDLCAQEWLNKGIRRAKIYILSDSQAALKAHTPSSLKLPGNVSNPLSNWIKTTGSP